jgi:hypothetical protein
MRAVMVIDAAHERDLPAVRRLLETQALPLDGVDQHLTMVVAKDGNRLVGAAAVELYADGALLRSVVVDPDVRGLFEFVATFGLLAVIWGCSRRRSAAVPFAVAAYITAAYWFTASTSFANPAVTFARAFTDTFAGIRPGDVPGFVFAQFAGAGGDIPVPMDGSGAARHSGTCRRTAFGSFVR